MHDDRASNGPLDQLNPASLSPPTQFQHGRLVHSLSQFVVDGRNTGAADVIWNRVPYLETGWGFPQRSGACAVGAMRKHKHPTSIPRVQVLDRAIAILNCFSEEKPQMGVGELARGAGISKATVHRLLAELQLHGWILQNADDKRYRLGFKLVELGSRVVDRLDFAPVAGPFLSALALDTGETAHLAILDDGMCYYVAKVESRYSIRMRSYVGKRNPAHCTGVGKVLLAFAAQPEVDRIVASQGLPKFTRRTITQTRRLFEELARIRERGYAIDDQEFEDGLRCIAAPVRDHTNTVVAALSVSGLTTRMTDETLPKIAGKAVRLANEISVALGLPPERARDGSGHLPTPRPARDASHV